MPSGDDFGVRSTLLVSPSTFVTAPRPSLLWRTGRTPTLASIETSDVPLSMVLPALSCYCTRPSWRAPVAMRNSPEVTFPHDGRARGLPKTLRRRDANGADPPSAAHRRERSGSPGARAVGHFDANDRLISHFALSSSINSASGRHVWVIRCCGCFLPDSNRGKAWTSGQLAHV
jgi:hypothetical protein